VGVDSGPDRDSRGNDEQALEEIRRLFGRYRQVARHGMVTEHDVSAELRAQEPDEASGPAGR
jgi:hypothetical protein